jgi:hypothetical protein
LVTSTDAAKVTTFATTYPEQPEGQSESSPLGWPSQHIGHAIRPAAISGNSVAQPLGGVGLAAQDDRFFAASDEVGRYRYAT